MQKAGNHMTKSQRSEAIDYAWNGMEWAQALQDIAETPLDRKIARLTGVIAINLHNLSLTPKYCWLSLSTRIPAYALTILSLHYLTTPEHSLSLPLLSCMHGCSKHSLSAPAVLPTLPKYSCPVPCLFLHCLLRCYMSPCTQKLF